MTEDQFSAWLLFALPVLICLGDPIFSFQEKIILVLVVGFFPTVLFFITEKEFINDCKKGYNNWEESIFPIRMYKRWYDD